MNDWKFIINIFENKLFIENHKNKSQIVKYYLKYFLEQLQC